MEMKGGHIVKQFALGDTILTICDDACRAVSAEEAEMLLRELADEFYSAFTKQRWENEKN